MKRQNLIFEQADAGIYRTVIKTTHGRRLYFELRLQNGMAIITDCFYIDRKVDKLDQPWLLSRPQKLKSKVFGYSDEALLQIVEREFDRKYFGVEFREHSETSRMGQREYIRFYEQKSERYRFLILVCKRQNPGQALPDILSTRLKNKLHRSIFLEFARYHDEVGVVKSCYYCDRSYRESTRKVAPASLVSCFFPYTKSGILALVNAELECTFTHLLVTDDESLDVVGNGQPLCGNL